MVVVVDSSSSATYLRFVRTATPRRPTSQKSPSSAPHARLHCRYGVRFDKPIAFCESMSQKDILKKVKKKAENICIYAKKAVTLPAIWVYMYIQVE